MPESTADELTENTSEDEDGHLSINVADKKQFYKESALKNSLLKMKMNQLRKKNKQVPLQADKDYGCDVLQPDMDAQAFETAKGILMKQLVDEMHRRVQLEDDTKMQADSKYWYSLRENRITASNFGKICKMKTTTDTSKTIKNMLHGSVQCSATTYGKQNENVARQAVREMLEIVQENRNLGVNYVLTRLSQQMLHTLVMSV